MQGCELQIQSNREATYVISQLTAHTNADTKSYFVHKLLKLHKINYILCSIKDGDCSHARQ